MDDAITLWKPLNKREQRLPVAKIPVALDRSYNKTVHGLSAAEHDSMRRYLYRLTHDSRDLTVRVLSRAQIHLPVVVEGVRRMGLPPEIACLPLVESAFEPQSVSSAGAAGLWQLMPQTARDFGLKVTNTEDERFNVRKATEAATSYLAYLYERFKNWPLALAAYNCGEGKMQKALEQSGCSTLDSLIAYCRDVAPERRPLKEETIRFVPQFAAAVMAMTNARLLGLPPSPLMDETPRAAIKKIESRLSLVGRYDNDESPASTPPQRMRKR
jgi:membrane-bound lytic murein transglycosylase D